MVRLLLFSLLCNGLVAYFFGELVSEALGTGLTCLILLLACFKGGVKANFSSLLAIVPLVAIMFSAAFHAFFYGEYYRLLFLYPYILAILIILNSSNGFLASFLSSDNVGIVLVWLGFATVIFSVFQRFDLAPILLKENEMRATGLSRTSLNLSGILLTLMLLYSVFYTGWIRLELLFLIFIGLIAAGGRGAIFSFFLYIAINIFLKMPIRSSRVWLLFPLVILVIILALVFHPGIFERLFSVFDFTHDQSNLDRLDSYLLFFKLFEFSGAGVGTTSPGAGRFGSFLGFESFIFNTLYEIGILGAIGLLFSLAIFFLKLSTTVKKEFAIFFISIFPVLLGQQIHASPSVFSFLCFGLVIAASRLSSRSSYCFGLPQ